MTDKVYPVRKRTEQSYLLNQINKLMTIKVFPWFGYRCRDDIAPLPARIPRQIGSPRAIHRPFQVGGWVMIVS